MSSWAQRMHRRAATLGNVVTSCGHPGPEPYPHRLEKVKFGVPLDEVCKNDIPGPLLVLILKLNKEAPLRKDVFRAPGHQGAMKKLVHFLQAGRLVNVDNYSVYTIASVLKKFLRKLPGGVFGREGEARLFTIIDMIDEEQQREEIHRLMTSLPGHTQRLLVLLFGTFRVIASNAERAGTGMSSEALGVSVAPSFFQSCVSDGKTARMEDVLRFKVATRIMKQLIEQFAAADLFGRDNYEYYARVTGRVLRVRDEWICSFRYPPPPRGASAQQSYARQLSLEAEKTWLQCESERWVMKYNLGGLSAQEESQSTPVLLSGAPVGASAVSLGIIPEHSLLESCARLSVSLEGPGLYTVPASSRSSSRSSRSSSNHMTMDELRAVNRYAESTKSLTYLPQVHERQTARMRTRSEWFLGARGGSLELGPNLHDRLDSRQPGSPGSIGTVANYITDMHCTASSNICTQNIATVIATATTTTTATATEIVMVSRSKTDIENDMVQNRIIGPVGLSASAESVHQKQRQSIRRGGSRHLHRSTSRRNKENGSRPGSFRKNADGTISRGNSFKNDEQKRKNNEEKRKNREERRAVSFEQQPSRVSWCETVTSGKSENELQLMNSVVPMETNESDWPVDAALTVTLTYKPRI